MHNHSRRSGSLHLLEEIPLTLPERALLRDLRLPQVVAIDEIPDPALRRDVWRAVHSGLELTRPRALARWVELTDGADGVSQLASNLFGEHRQELAGCVRATVVVLTLGPALDERIAALRESALADAYHLDTVGQTLATAVEETVAQDVERAIRKAGCSPSSRVTLEDEVEDEAAQAAALEVCAAHRIGVSVSGSGELRPDKSRLLVIGWREGGG